MSFSKVKLINLHGVFSEFNGMVFDFKKKGPYIGSYYFGNNKGELLLLESKNFRPL